MPVSRSSDAFENGLPLPYAGLPYVDDVERFDPAGDAPRFAALADILIDEGLEETFGVNLLHVHFTLAEGETVWKTTTGGPTACPLPSVRAVRRWRMRVGRHPGAFSMAGGCRSPSPATASTRRSWRARLPPWSGSADCWKNPARPGASGSAWRGAACAPGRCASTWSGPTRPAAARSLRRNGRRCATGARTSTRPGHSIRPCWRVPALSATRAPAAGASARRPVLSEVSTDRGTRRNTRRRSETRQPRRNVKAGCRLSHSLA